MRKERGLDNRNIFDQLTDNGEAAFSLSVTMLNFHYPRRSLNDVGERGGTCTQ